MGTRVHFVPSNPLFLEYTLQIYGKITDYILLGKDDYVTNLCFI